jgi:hypothetical protein
MGAGETSQLYHGLVYQLHRPGYGVVVVRILRSSQAFCLFGNTSGYGIFHFESFVVYFSAGVTLLSSLFYLLI